MLGADLLPTTFSLYALGIQIHHIVHNVVERLSSQEDGRRAMLTTYDGSTCFYLYLGQKEIVKVNHKYEGKDY